jgi:AraC-like DNA-binding protein
MCFGLFGVMLADQVIPMTGVNTDRFYQLMLIIVSTYNLILCYSALGFSRIDFSENDNHKMDDRHYVEPIHQDSVNLAVNRKYEKSSLRMDSAAYYGDKLKRLMEEERYFLDNAVSPRTLAKKINVSGHHLSQILNEQFQKTFYDFINEQRVEFAKGLLLRDKNTPVLDIAFESGFNNKVTFYNAFKRYVGMTPTEYRKCPTLISVF